jgi:hypothetical protein
MSETSSAVPETKPEHPEPNTKVESSGQQQKPRLGINSSDKQNPTAINDSSVQQQQQQQQQPEVPGSSSEQQKKPESSEQPKPRAKIDSLASAASKESFKKERDDVKDYLQMDNLAAIFSSVGLHYPGKVKPRSEDKVKVVGVGDNLTAQRAAMSANTFSLVGKSPGNGGDRKEAKIGEGREDTSKKDDIRRNAGMGYEAGDMLERERTLVNDTLTTGEATLLDEKSGEATATSTAAASSREVTEREAEGVLKEREAALDSEADGGSVEEGDSVVIGVGEEKLRELQQGYGGVTDAMLEVRISRHTLLNFILLLPPHPLISPPNPLPLIPLHLPAPDLQLISTASPHQT